ncbi:lysine--tRNA ligase [Sulfurovum lithotrophicum]|uniref:Lysine--tRNA ligase n=1 Tax=Sulfurovum lithotrophicum TaxID=206403 RepID=A0A7U4RR58_9BACT|nr:lysine--tRNA ligase [Sulfurovum lithotrophicum]AKF25462.1 lysine--tRNA ligase [Sulfurovum lithotrophicum]
MIFDNQYIQERIKKTEKLREEGINPYPANTVKGMPSSDFFEHYAYVKEQTADEKKDEQQIVTLTGRIKFIRIMGKAAFAKIEDSDGLVQIYYNRDDLPEGYYNTVAKKLFEVGDIIEATGYPFVTQTGELTLHCRDLKIVSKAIMPLPEKFHGLTDHEIRYRQRYLDMIMNPEVKETFIMRSRIVSLIRRFFEDHSFLEVETPMMHPIPGGANAKPFVTHHNALGVDRYLRIAPELYLKRLTVGGMEAVFEINRNFRNEGMDQTHNPEFTSIEFYWAYHNYLDLMQLTEELFEYIFAQLQMDKTITYGEYEIDCSTPFAKVPFVEALTSIGEVPKEVANDREKAIAYLKEHGVEVNPNLTLGYLQAELFDEFVEGKLINPTFITDYPIDISPLSRRSDDNPDIAERFELFMAGKEIANGFNELNDPIDQFERFKAQADAKEATGDEETMHMDLDFIRALGHGMTPTAGEGIGIDRLVMMLTNNHSIRDVILFPAMKPEAKLEEAKAEIACKKCGNTNEEELKPAKKGKGFFCKDAAACNKRAQEKKA